MEGILLRKHGNLFSISEPSGKKISASKLEVGKIYLHSNYFFLRKILSIELNKILYLDLNFSTTGVCTKSHFASICPFEATDEEVKFIFKHKIG